MPNIGLPELVIILVIVILLFGASRLPQIGKGLGEGIKGFKDSLRDAQQDDKKNPPPPPPAPPAPPAS